MYGSNNEVRPGEFSRCSPMEKRGKFFDSLRENYPVRREFQNTQIVLANSVQRIADSERIIEKLVGIGFKI